MTCRSTKAVRLLAACAVMLGGAGSASSGATDADAGAGERDSTLHPGSKEQTAPAPARDVTTQMLILPGQRREKTADDSDRIVHTTLKVSFEKVAFVTQHLWNDSQPGGPPVPENLMIGMGTRENSRRAKEINRRYILPALEAARQAGITVVHSQPAFIAHRYRQYKALVGKLAGKPPEPVWPPPEIPEYSEAEMAAWTVNTWPGWGQMDFPRELKPRTDEPVTVLSEELDHVLRERGVTTLVYVGYATDMCLIGYTGGLNDMVNKFGYRACVLREGTLATELGPDEDGPEKTAKSLELIEREYACTASVEDFIAAVQQHTHKASRAYSDRAASRPAASLDPGGADEQQGND